MTDIAKLASDVSTYTSGMESATSRYESLWDQVDGDGSTDQMRQVLEELRGVLASLEAIDGMDVSLRASIEEARGVLDHLDGMLDDVSETAPSVVQSTIDEVIAIIEAEFSNPPAIETLSARLQRRLREARAAEGEAIEDDMADGTEDDTEAEADAVEDADNADEDAGGVFDPMAFETVEAVDAEIARYDAEIAQINADLAGYEEAKRQLMERRDQIESGADAAIDEANAEAA